MMDGETTIASTDPSVIPLYTIDTIMFLCGWCMGTHLAKKTVGKCHASWSARPHTRTHTTSPLKPLQERLCRRQRHALGRSGGDAHKYHGAQPRASRGREHSGDARQKY